jgi:hypothetical protein
MGCVWNRYRYTTVGNECLCKSAQKRLIFPTLNQLHVKNFYISRKKKYPRTLYKLAHDSIYTTHFKIQTYDKMSPHDEDNEHGLPNPSSSDEASASSSQNILTTTWQNNKGVFLILLAQMTGSTMDAIVRYLQQQSGGHGMHPFQAIFARMSVTALLSSVYMWWTRVPDFPLGAKAVRGLLVLRAMAGFGGLFCLYCEYQFSRLTSS